MLLEGLHIPVTTPFHRDGRLNTHKLAANIARYSRTPASGLIVLGPYGEPTLLNDRETRDALEAAAQAAAPEKVLIGGVSRDSVRATLDLANFAAEQKVDAILVNAPSVLDSPDASRALPTYFRAVADGSPLPLIVSSTQNRAMSLDAIAELATHSNIIGLISDDVTATKNLLAKTASYKRDVSVTHVFAAVTRRMQTADSQADNSLISPASLTTTVAAPPARPVLRTRTKSVGFQILGSCTPKMLDALNAGAVGIAPAFAACAPQACYEVFAAWKDQDEPLASEKQQRILDAARLIESLGPSALKFAADLNGYFGGIARLPHLPLDAEQRHTLERLMQPIRN